MALCIWLLITSRGITDITLAGVCGVLFVSYIVGNKTPIKNYWSRVLVLAFSPVLMFMVYYSDGGIGAWAFIIIVSGVPLFIALLIEQNHRDKTPALARDTDQEINLKIALEIMANNYKADVEALQKQIEGLETGGKNGKVSEKTTALQIMEMTEPFTQQALKKRRTALLKKVHPDTGGSNTFAQMVNEAYDLLKK